MPGRPLDALFVLGALAFASVHTASADPAGSLAGVVVYADADWQRAFVLRDDGTPAPIPSKAIAALPAPGHRAEVAADGITVRDLGRVAWPDAPPLGPSPASGLHWVTVDATVRGVVPAQATRIYLRVSSHGREIDVHVPSPAPREPGMAPLPGARVRVQGVLEPAADAWSRPRLWVAEWMGDAITAPSPSWEEVREVAAPELPALAASGFEDEVRLVGRPVSRHATRSFTVASASGTITVDLDRPDYVRARAPIEIRAFVASRHGEVVLERGRWRNTGVADFQASRRESGLRELTRVDEVRALPRTEAERGYPVRLEAVVTFASSPPGLVFVQDDTGGVYVHVDQPPTRAHTGERVRVEGFTAPGGLAPMVVDPRLTRLGPARLPPARPVSAARLAAGFDDCRRVQTSGYVRSVRRRETEVEIVLGVEGMRVPVHAPLAMVDADLPPVDARVRVDAVCGTAFNWRSILDHVELFVAASRDIVVEERPGDPFSLPLFPVRDLLRSAPGERWERLVRTRGVVLHRRDDQPLYLRAPTGTVVVETRRAEPVEPGDELDVVGFPAPGSGAPRLRDATFRKIGAGPPPEPVATGAGRPLGQDLEAELVRVRATLLEVVPRRNGSVLVLETADDVVAARGAGDLDPPPPEQSTVEVTGILASHDDGTEGAPGPHLVLRTPSDVRVTQRPPWLTPARAARAIAAFAGAALVALAWVVTLRRRVSVRTKDLAAAERRYRLLADNASDVIVTTDADLRLTYVSPSVTRDSGYTAQEALAMPLERVLTAESWALLRSALGRAGEQADDRPTELGIELVRKDGRLVFMHVRARAMRDAAGRLTGFCAAARDVTARRQAEREVARLAAAIEQSADAIVLTDPQGKILYVNPAFERVTGYPADEVLGGNPSVLKSGAHDRAFYEAMWRTLVAGDTWEGRFTNRRKDGRLFLEDATISPVRDRESRLIGYVAVKRDVTRQVEMEGQASQGQKMEAVGRLAAGVAHDFNNVLAIILSLSDLALQRGDENERTRRCIDGIREAALRAGGLTRQILTFGRQTPAARQPLDPREVVGEAAGMLRHLVPRGVDVRTRLTSTLRVTADPTQLHQVVLNLGTNAGLAMADAGGVVEVALEDACVDEAFAESHPPLCPGACLRLVVRDDGYGMTPETLSHIFEPFFTTRGPRDGTGMGLAVVHGIVHGHGGAITVASEVGRGSTFSVYLPALSPPPGDDGSTATV